MDLIYRFDPFAPINKLPVHDVAAARSALQQGNSRFVEIATRMQRRALGHEAGEPLVIPVSPISLGLPLFPGAPPTQAPFALVLGCSDARVPIEAVFDLSFNDLFVVRIAGNVLGTECLGSIDYAARSLSSLRLVLVLGHTNCGAVTAAVDGYLSYKDFGDIAFTHSLRSLVDRIHIAVRGAAKSLKQVGGDDVASHPSYRELLIEASVYLNAAITAHDLNREIRTLLNPPLPVAYAVYDLQQLGVQALPWCSATPATGDTMFADPPAQPEDFVTLGARIADRLLNGRGGGSGSINWSTLKV